MRLPGRRGREGRGGEGRGGKGKGREGKGGEGEGEEGRGEGMGCFYLGPPTSKCVATALLIYVRQDIPSKKLIKHTFPHDIEGLCIEINLRKCKWFLCGTYHPPSQSDKYYFENMGKVIDLYNGVYDKMLLVGDFNAEEGELCIDSILYEYSFKNLVKQKTCFKNPENPSCFDLFITNSANSFQNTTTLSCGLSDRHKMVVTVLKTHFSKAKPKEIIYRTTKISIKQLLKMN